LDLFSPSSTGDQPPATTISGAATGLDNPLFVAFTPPPVAVTGPVRHVKAHRVTLTGTVTPDGSQTTWSFLYRPASGGAWTHTRIRSAGASASTVRLRIAVGDLRAATTYRYELVARNPGGYTTGQVRAFTTSWPPSRRDARLRQRLGSHRSHQRPTHAARDQRLAPPATKQRRRAPIPPASTRRAPGAGSDEVAPAGARAPSASATIASTIRASR